MGKLTDRFMNAFNGKDEEYDDYDDEFYGDELPEEDDEQPDEQPEKSSSGGGIFGRRPKQQPVQDDKEPRDLPPRERERERESTSRYSGPFSKGGRGSRGGSSQRVSSNEVCIFKPSSIEDSREITETLLSGKAVVINFEGLHVEISQRIIDFISGSCYALDGNLQKISNYIFIATPNSVDISGDFQDLFGGDENSFDIAGFKSPMV